MAERAANDLQRGDASVRLARQRALSGCSLAVKREIPSASQSRLHVGHLRKKISFLVVDGGEPTTMRARSGGGISNLPFGSLRPAPRCTIIRAYVAYTDKAAEVLLFNIS